MKQTEPNTVASPPGQNKIVWLSIIQGWAILLVVIGHVNAFTYSDVENEMYPLARVIHSLIYAFHMPLFMFVSGGLLYYTRIDRSWPTPRLYVDKIKRLLIPYIFFSIFTLILKGLLSSYTKRGAEMTVAGFVNTLWDPANGPLGEMWFIGTLMWLMAMYPVYKIALKWQWTELILLAMTLLPFLLSADVRINGWLNVAAVPQYAFFFITGILFFKYKLYGLLEHRLWVTVILTAAFVAENYYIDNIPLVKQVTGILMSFGWGIWIADRAPRLFDSFRDHSFQIFLLGIFPQMFVELFVWKRFHNEWLQIPYYLLSCALAIVFAVFVSKYAGRIKTPWIRWCLGLK